jgi:broad specificity phosphatase PhoE
MKWYIIRHAEKEKGDYFNPILRHQDEPISSRGLVESQKLWDYFSGKTINRVYISQYKRTGQTIEFTARKLGINPIKDARLNEIDNGLLDGMTDKQVEKKFPKVWKDILDRDHDFQFPGGECGEDARKRINSFMLEKQKDNEDIVVVCHEGLIRLWLCHLLGLPVYQRRDFKVDFCGIMEIEFNPEYGKWKLIRFNQMVDPGG